jgi:hypothetical protein
MRGWRRGWWSRGWGPRRGWSEGGGVCCGWATPVPSGWVERRPSPDASPPRLGRRGLVGAQRPRQPPRSGGATDRRVPAAVLHDERRRYDVDHERRAAHRLGMPGWYAQRLLGGLGCGSDDQSARRTCGSGRSAERTCPGVSRWDRCPRPPERRGFTDRTECAGRFRTRIVSDDRVPAGYRPDPACDRFGCAER